MRVPVLEGVIARRILANWRVDPDVVARLLPGPLRPRLLRGHALAGICLIRLAELRPRGMPRFLGITVENAAHRFAVTWEEGGREREGVYVPRRDTSSRIACLMGGRVFPGEQHLAHFDVEEEGGVYRVALRSRDGACRISVDGRVAPVLPPDSIFASIGEASRFFECGSLGWSATASGDRLDGLELVTHDWAVRPLGVVRVESSFFDDPEIFPPGTASFDSALLMTEIEHAWHARPALSCAESEACAAT